jgi:hypothetical protein
VVIRDPRDRRTRLDPSREADTLVPVAHARHTAELVPTAKLLTWPDEGQISIFDKIPRLTADLVAPLR